MEFSYAPYQMKMRSGAIREGALLRVSFSQGSYGYADCHPWVEFGDLNINEQLKALKNGRLTPLLKRSLHFAKIEAAARKNNRSVFEGLPLLKSHLQVNIGDSFTYPLVKVKLKPDQADAFFHWAPKEPLWRLDFNSSFSANECEKFLKRVKDLKIDFIEDPSPYNGPEWKRLQNTYGVKFAEDFERGDEAQVTVWKPAVHDIPQTTNRCIATSYIDHPIGQLSALYSAALSPTFRNEAGGFITHTLYEPNAFIDKLQTVDGQLMPPKGIGWGFDEELEKLTWM